MDTEGGQQSETVVVDIAGKVTIGYDAKMRDAIAEAREAGARNILLNMRGVTRLDSSGIGELVAAHASVTNAGGRLLLVGLPNKVATVLQITNLLGILELFDDIDEAIAALESESD
ncbi:MAG: STAS domain-containing protein [Thermoanaerobaculia bacterium]